MVKVTLNNAASINEAALAAHGWLKTNTFDEQQDFCLSIGVTENCEDGFMAAVNGVVRCFYQNEHSGLKMLGLGVAERFLVSSAWEEIPKFIDTLAPEQVIFAASKFDPAALVSEEWHNFAAHNFFLPLVTVLGNDLKTLLIAFRKNGLIPKPVWQDQALMILNALIHHEKHARPGLGKISANAVHPKQEGYGENLARALTDFSLDKKRLKVVIGRRNTLSFDVDIDAWHMFQNLKTANPQALLFFFDNGRDASFFGASPELLFNQANGILTTAALAGTRSRAATNVRDFELRNELLTSFKDIREHDLVCEYIEATLAGLARQHVSKTPVSILKTPTVQHLYRGYSLELRPDASIGKILNALHPTPAVCGLDREWARSFLREHEGFDRGLFAGPIGILGKDFSQFAVAIRSGLKFNKTLMVYAASGIVDGSVCDLEWEELDNKQKNILNIFLSE